MTFALTKFASFMSTNEAELFTGISSESVAAVRATEVRLRAARQGKRARRAARRVAGALPACRAVVANGAGPGESSQGGLSAVVCKKVLEEGILAISAMG